MGLKKKLAMGVATGALAVSMIGGGTYAYFHDAQVNNNSFTAGTLDINVNQDNKAIIDVDNLKPGDWMEREFKLHNDGSLDISQVVLKTNYTVVDGGLFNGEEDFGKHIIVESLKSNGIEIINSPITLSDLKLESLDLIKSASASGSGLGTGKSMTLKVKMKFDDNKKDQNVFQKDTLNLEWTFDAHQTAGKEIKTNK